jgi:hypothetical protein
VENTIVYVLLFANMIQQHYYSWLQLTQFPNKYCYLGPIVSRPFFFLRGVIILWDSVPACMGVRLLHIHSRINNIQILKSSSSHHLVRIAIKIALAILFISVLASRTPESNSCTGFIICNNPCFTYPARLYTSSKYPIPIFPFNICLAYVLIQWSCLSCIQISSL